MPLISSNGTSRSQKLTYTFYFLLINHSAIIGTVSINHILSFTSLQYKTNFIYNNRIIQIIQQPNPSNYTWKILNPSYTEIRAHLSNSLPQISSNKISPKFDNIGYTFYFPSTKSFYKLLLQYKFIEQVHRTHDCIDTGICIVT